MIKRAKRSAAENEVVPTKKLKKSSSFAVSKSKSKSEQTEKGKNKDPATHTAKPEPSKEIKQKTKLGKKEKPKTNNVKFKNQQVKGGKPLLRKRRTLNANRSPNAKGPPNGASWAEYKKQQKQVRLKRKQKNKLYDINVEAKQIAETLRRKQLEGGKSERTKLVTQLHSLLDGQGHYEKLVLSHDMARIVQYMLKFAPENIRKEVSKELIPISAQMLQSKYGRYCLKSMLKYGNSEVRSAVIKALYGNAVKLTSHVVSAAVFEYAFSTWATLQQKQHLIQEFFGDMYKQTKDDQVKHLRDVYKDSPSMKNAALSATKANLSRILKKGLLDSGLVQSVLYQFLTECSTENKTELISQLAPHVVILSNSKDGARASMECIWHGSNKDRKVAMKAIKEHVCDLSMHEHGHCSVICLLDTADDTVLLNKMIISQILGDVQNLAADEWGRKVLLWLVAPADSTHFHPVFVKELEAGRQASASKKEPYVRRKELLNYTSSSLLKLVASSPEFWLSTASIAMVTLAVLKSGSGSDVKEALKSIAKTVANASWKIKEGANEVLGIEHPGIHMTLKKLAQHDKVAVEPEGPTFGRALLDVITNEVIELWITFNRGCFLLVAIYENGTTLTQQELKQKLTSHVKFLKKQTTSGAQVLLKKVQ